MRRRLPTKSSGWRNTPRLYMRRCREIFDALATTLEEGGWISSTELLGGDSERTRESKKFHLEELLYNMHAMQLVERRIMLGAGVREVWHYRLRPPTPEHARVWVSLVNVDDAGTMYKCGRTLRSHWLARGSRSHATKADKTEPPIPRALVVALAGSVAAAIDLYPRWFVNVPHEQHAA